MPLPAAPAAIATVGKTSFVPLKVPARLFAELREVQDASAMESRLLAGVSDLFEELAMEDRQRRAAWEDKAERSLREIRASVEADVARGACECRRMLSDARREAAEARRLAEPCSDFVAALERHEAAALLPPTFAALVRREAQTAAVAEVERFSRDISQQLSEESSEQVSRTLRGESSRWAKACADQMADTILMEQHARESSTKGLEARISEVEACTAQCQEAQGRIGARFGELQEANAILQSLIDRYAERWELAWREEAKLRKEGDALAEASAAAAAAAAAAGAGQTPAPRLLDPAAATAALAPAAAPAEAEAAGQTAAVVAISKLRAQVEHEERARQDCDSRLLARLVELQNELRIEEEVRTAADARLASGVDQLRCVCANAILASRVVTAAPSPLSSPPALANQSRQGLFEQKGDAVDVATTQVLGPAAATPPPPSAVAQQLQVWTAPTVGRTMPVATTPPPPTTVAQQLQATMSLQACGSPLPPLHRGVVVHHRAAAS